MDQLSGALQLNVIRNRLAHRIGYTVTDTDISPMRDALKIWNDAAGKPMPNGLDVVQTFTELACGFLDGTIQSIKRHGRGAGLHGLFEWYREGEEAEQGGTGQPATRPESKSEGGDKPQPEAERRSR